MCELNACVIIIHTPSQGYHSQGYGIVSCSFCLPYNFLCTILLKIQLGHNNYWLPRLLSVNYNTKDAFNNKYVFINTCNHQLTIRIRRSLTYSDSTYPDYSLIRTHVWESHSLFRIFSYQDSQPGNRGVQISASPL